MSWESDNQVWNLDSPYGNALKPAYEAGVTQQDALGSNDRAGLLTRLNSLGDQFKSSFTNLVGRAPTSEEIGQFFQQSAGSILTGAPNGRTENDTANVRNQVTGFVGDNFQKAANDYATQQLTDQQGQANDLAQLFRKQGNQAISNTEQSLLDFQQKLFERLRPNLITSLDAQGLLDTGGLNQALAGAQERLGESAQGALLDARMQNEQGANAIAFGGASAPFLFKQNQITQQPGFLQQMGQNALGMNYNTYMTDLNFRHSLEAMNYQRLMNEQQAENVAPSFGRTLSQNFASSMGTNLGTNFNGPNWMAAWTGGQQKNAAAAAAAGG